jgi:hypothetical protein
MSASKFNGRQVLYVDNLRLAHSGIVVGQSADGAWTYIQSDNPDVKPAEWHFKVSTRLLPGVLVKQANQN